MATKKKSVEELRENKIINQAKREVPGFAELLHRFERTVSVLGRSQSTFSKLLQTRRCGVATFRKNSYRIGSRANSRLPFLPSEKSKSPSQSYFKHTVYGLRFLLKSEGLSYDYLSLPEIKREKNCL